MTPKAHFNPPVEMPSTLTHSILRRWLDGGSAIVDSDGVIHKLNGALADWFEVPASELIGQNFWALLQARAGHCADELESFRHTNQDFGELTLKLTASRAQTPHWYQLECAGQGQVRFVRLDSALPPATEMAEAPWDEFLRSESSHRDLFMRLLRAETQLQNLTQRWPGVIFSQRPDFSFHFITPNIVDLTGIPVSDWQQKPNLLWQIVHESDTEELQQQLKTAARAPEGVTTTFRVRHLQTGRIAYLLEQRQALLSPNGLVLGYEGVWLDITRQTIAEKRLSSAAWKETLALLTMGLAHDFTNIMAGIHSLSESFLSQLDPSHPFREGIALIKTNSLQASQLVHRIINLHRGKTGEKGYFNLNEVIADLLELIRKIVPRRIDVQTELSPGTLAVYLDVVEFRQVIVNLALNAVDAMPQTGKLVLRASAHRELPQPGIHFYGPPPRFPAACLSIADNGCGIKPRHLANIFDPFFTTKAMNKGSGLGLYNARVFLEKSNGAISVETCEGVGTTFHLWFPQADFTESQSRPLPESLPRQRRSLLVAGQPGDTLESIAEFLRSHDFHVVTAISQQNALELLASPNYQFSGLMLVFEPNDTGYTGLFSKVKSLNRSLKTILKPIGRDHEEIQNTFLDTVDLVISPDLTQPDIIEKIRAMFEVSHS